MKCSSFAKLNGNSSWHAAKAKSAGTIMDDTPITQFFTRDTGAIHLPFIRFRTVLELTVLFVNRHL